MKKIFILLPHKEKFSKDKSGSASIWVKDFIKLSNFNNEINVYGANVSSFLNEFFGLGSFLVPIFLFFQTIKIIKRDKIVFLILRFFLFFASLVFSGIFLNYISLNSGLLGEVSYKIFSNQI